MQDARSQPRYRRSAEDSPWNRRFSILCSVIFTLCAAAVALIYTYNDLPYSQHINPYSNYVLPLFVLFNAALLISIATAGAGNIWRILESTFIFGLAAAPSVATVIVPSHHDWHPWILIASISFWVLVCICSADNFNSSAWRWLLSVLAITSAVSSAILFVGSVSPLDFVATSVDRITGLRYFLDVRATTGALFVFLSLATATTRAFMDDTVDVPSIDMPDVSVPNSNSIWDFLVRPIVEVFGWLLFVLISLINILIGIVCYLGLKLNKIGLELGKLLWKIFVNDKVIVPIFKTSTAASIVFLLTMLSVQASPHIILYLRGGGMSDTWGELSVLVVSFSVVLSAGLIHLLMEGSGASIGNLLYGFALTTVLLFLSSIIVHVISYANILDINGFDSVGTMTIAGFFVVVLGVVYAFGSNIRQTISFSDISE